MRRLAIVLLAVCLVSNSATAASARRVEREWLVPVTIAQGSRAARTADTMHRNAKAGAFEIMGYVDRYSIGADERDSHREARVVCEFKLPELKERSISAACLVVGGADLRGPAGERFQLAISAYSGDGDIHSADFDAGERIAGPVTMDCSRPMLQALVDVTAFVRKQAAERAHYVGFLLHQPESHAASVGATLWAGPAAGPGAGISLQLALAQPAATPSSSTTVNEPAPASRSAPGVNARVSTAENAVLDDLQVAQRASAVVQLDAELDPQITAVQEPGNVAASVMSSSVVVEAAAKKVLQLNPDAVRELISVTATRTGQRLARIEVRLREVEGKSWGADDADRLLRAVVVQLEAALNESSAASRAQLERSIASLEEQRAKTGERLKDLLAKQEKLRAALWELPGGYRDPRYGLNQAEQQLNQEESQLTQLQDRLAEVDPGTSESLEAFEKLVKLQEQKLAELREAGKPAAEIKEAELQLAAAQANLETLRREANRTDRNRFPSQELSRLKRQIAQSEQKIAKLRSALDKLSSPEFRDLMSQAQSTEQQTQSLSQEILELDNRRRMLARQNSIPPRYAITLLDGNPDEPPQEK